MRLTLWWYVLLSVLSVCATVGNAYWHKQQFYTACVYLANSNISMMNLYNFVLMIGLLVTRVLQKLFFGTLRTIEIEHLYEKTWLTFTETCFAMALFKNSFDARFIGLFSLLILAKTFHWLLQDRIDFMEHSPSVTVGFHLRMLGLMSSLVVFDVAFAMYAANVVMKGPSLMILFGFEYTILAMVVLASFLKYVVHSIDLRREEPWHNKSIFIFGIELLFDFVKLIIYAVFFMVVYAHYGVPFHLLRDLYHSFFSFWSRLTDMIKYRRATANMNERYPDATPEELDATDRVCIICREEMEVGKKLPCGHIFHFNCLRSWLERQQSCPTCRTNVFGEPPRRPAAGAGQAEAQPEPAQGGPVHAHQHPPAAPAHENRDFVFENRSQRAAPRYTSLSENSFGTATSATAPLAQAPGAIFTEEALLLPLSMFGQFGLPGDQPRPSVPLDQLSEEQLRAMEGNERRHTEERIKFLQGIQGQINGIIVQLTQYQQITSADIPSSAPSPSSSSSQPQQRPQQQQQQQPPPGFSFGAASRRGHAKED